MGVSETSLASASLTSLRLRIPIVDRGRHRPLSSIPSIRPRDSPSTSLDLMRVAHAGWAIQDLLERRIGAGQLRGTSCRPSRIHNRLTSRISQGHSARITWAFFDTLQIMGQRAEAASVAPFPRPSAASEDGCRYHRGHRLRNTIGYGTCLLYPGGCSYCNRLLIVGSPPLCRDTQNRSTASGNRTERPSVVLPVSVALIRLTFNNRNQPPSDLANGFDSRYGSLREVEMLIHGCGVGATLRYVQVFQAKLYVLILVFCHVCRCSRA